MKSKIAALWVFTHILFFILPLSLWGDGKVPLLSPCPDNSPIKLSAVYSPYSVHLIKAQISGTVTRINAEEGTVLKARLPIMELDCSHYREELQKLKSIKADIEKSIEILNKNLQLTKKKYERYNALFKKSHIEKQALENIEMSLNQALVSLLNAKQQKNEIARAILQLKNTLDKCAPSFDRDLYVSQNFKELFETAMPGEPLARLMDISKAKLHIVLPERCFKRVKKMIIRNKNQIKFILTSQDGRSFELNGTAEKVKIDTDSEYLYSYSFDLIFTPVKGLLFGEVVEVQLTP